MAECEKCGDPHAFRRKHIGLVGEEWIELSVWMWLCNPCAAQMKAEVDAAEVKAREAEANV